MTPSQPKSGEMSDSNCGLSVGRSSSEDLRPTLPVQPRPLDYPLSDYRRAPADGPLHFTWIDKPHRVVYDLASGYAYLLASHQRLAEALKQITAIKPTGYHTAIAGRALASIPKETP